MERIRKTIANISLFSLFGTAIGILISMDYIYTNFLIPSSREPLIWAMTTTFGAISFFSLLNYCAYAQSIVQDEVDRVSKAKSALEMEILNLRRSSDKSRRKK